MTIEIQYLMSPFFCSAAGVSLSTSCGASATDSADVHPGTTAPAVAAACAQATASSEGLTVSPSPCVPATPASDSSADTSAAGASDFSQVPKLTTSAECQ